MHVQYTICAERILITVSSMKFLGKPFQWGNFSPYNINNSQPSRWKILGLRHWERFCLHFYHKVLYLVVPRSNDPGLPELKNLVSPPGKHDCHCEFVHMFSSVPLSGVTIKDMCDNSWTLRNLSMYMMQCVFGSCLPVLNLKFTSSNRDKERTACVQLARATACCGCSYTS